MLVETGLDLAAPEAGSGAVLKIFVLDDAGEPHNGSMVAWARPVGGTFKDDVGADVVDQRDGSCLLESLPEGDWNIRVQGFVKGDAEHPPELGGPVVTRQLHLAAGSHTEITVKLDEPAGKTTP
jgi:hypothetical protein